jgi:hypothetical protein
LWGCVDKKKMGYTGSMKNKYLAGLFALSVIGSGVGYMLTNSTIFGFCTHDEYSCRDLLNNIGDPLYYGMGALALIFFMLYFVPQAIRAWFKFAKWFVPLAALLFIFYPDPGSGNLLAPYPEQVFQWVSALYVIVSVIIIAIASAGKHEKQ